ncbi:MULTISPECIES: hypothetical protein [unclassified Nostoc]|uniref:hypothetical protein n=1 Tax=unclassified Nostoc TaxID=2593658 RepID=UPI002AD1E2DF|nr:MULTISPECIES: hypothetical protein [unclassified Nostoc]MDZ8124023.1 hypothetical protein [Nostoc sp. CmiVER01]MDZ8224652.1 hypothetical protein [Nostoc sp. ChiVER01]
MSLQELKEQAFKLSVSDRFALISALIQSLQTASQTEDWKYLVTRPHPWRRQLYIKGRLHQAEPVHPGILAVYQNSDSSKNMSYQSIVAAIFNLEAMSYVLKNQFVILNQSMELLTSPHFHRKFF